MLHGTNTIPSKHFVEVLGFIRFALAKYFGFQGLFPAENVTIFDVLRLSDFHKVIWRVTEFL